MTDEPTDTTIKFPALEGMARNHATARDSCGDCNYFKFDAKNVKMGACHGNPPVFLMTQHGPVPARPMLGSNDLACRHFKPSK